MLSHGIVMFTGFQNPPLKNLLLQLGDAFYTLYEDLDVLEAKRGAFRGVAEDCRRQRDSLLADDKPSWAEEYFLDAVHSQDWGETSNVWHEMTPGVRSGEARFMGMNSSDACMRYPVRPGKKVYSES